MFLCAICNALPSSWFTYAAVMALGGPGAAIPLTAITALALVITKGLSFQRFLNKLWENEAIQRCLTCGGDEGVRSTIEWLCCCTPRKRGDSRRHRELGPEGQVALLERLVDATERDPVAREAMADAMAEVAMGECLGVGMRRGPATGAALPVGARGGRPAVPHGYGALEELPSAGSAAVGLRKRRGAEARAECCFWSYEAAGEEPGRHSMGGRTASASASGRGGDDAARLGQVDGGGGAAVWEPLD